MSLLLLDFFFLFQALGSYGDENVMYDDVVLRNTSKSSSSNFHSNRTGVNNTSHHNDTAVVPPPHHNAVVNAPQDNTNAHDDTSSKTVFVLCILISFCVIAVFGVVLTVVCWVRVFSHRRSEKDAETKAKDAENLDKRNMRDVQLSEYAKRKRQMQELDNEEDKEDDEEDNDSESEDDIDEITAVQSQPLDEETIVNPNFIHHYLSTPQATHWSCAPLKLRKFNKTEQVMVPAYKSDMRMDGQVFFGLVFYQYQRSMYVVMDVILCIIITVHVHAFLLIGVVKLLLLISLNLN